VKKMLRAAEMAQAQFGGDVPAERKALQLFPSIGKPGAEKIPLFTKTAPVVALESNGLRVLVRLGYGREEKNRGDLSVGSEAGSGRSREIASG
jgi:adenine-specific DNA glycosylase